VSGRGRQAALPSAAPKTIHGMVAGPGGSLVRCFSQDGQAHRDYDFSGLTTDARLRDAMVAAFAKRTAPGAGLTSLASVDKVYLATVRFDRYLAGMARPPAEPAQLTREHYNGFCSTRSHLANASRELGNLRSLLAKVEGISDELAGHLAGPLPKRRAHQPRQSYSRAEFQRIAESARADLRAAARRIRGNRDLLDQFRAGNLQPVGDPVLSERLQLLDVVDRLGDVPRVITAKGRTAGRACFPRWRYPHHGTVPEVMSLLHLTYAEAAAGAVLLAVMTGQNPEVIINTPAAHHRADGDSDGPGTAIVGLRKLRRGPRAHMNLALTEVPDWISIPGKPKEITARDELHTPFGLYILLHELTARSRAIAGENRLLIGYCQRGGQGTGRGLRPLNAKSDGSIAILGRSYGLVADAPGADGNPAPLPLRLDLLRLTYIELHQKPVAHTETTAATQYLARNRGNITQYREVVADTLTDEAAKARARGIITTMPARDVERARSDPETVAAEYHLNPVTLKKMIAGELDTVMASCTDNTGGPYAPPGESCTASFMLCLDCECARALPHHLPVQVLVHDALTQRRDQMDPLQWAHRFALPYAQLTDLLSQHDETAIADSRRDATDADRLMVDRFLRRELDLR
jgi:hypothetical protein